MMERRGIQRRKLGERKVTRRREGARMTGTWGVGVFCRACKDQSFLFLYGVVPDLERTNWVGVGHRISSEHVLTAHPDMNTQVCMLHTSHQI